MNFLLSLNKKIFLIFSFASFIIILFVFSLNSSSIKTRFINALDLLNVEKNASLVEKIKKFHLSNENFSIENGLLTPTMKVKRKKVTEKYKKELENLYL